MIIATSYFYQIRNFKPWMIPVSTCLNDPQWYKPPPGKEYFIDKRGIINGLRYQDLIVQPGGCPCEYHHQGNAHCYFLTEYRKRLYQQVDRNKVKKAFQFCANKFQKELCLNTEPIIVLMVYEAPNNPCSERKILQEVFNCQELSYPIGEKYEI